MTKSQLEISRDASSTHSSCFAQLPRIPNNGFIKSTPELKQNVGDGSASFKIQIVKAPKLEAVIVEYEDNNEEHGRCYYEGIYDVQKNPPF